MEYKYRNMSMGAIVEKAQVEDDIFITQFARREPSGTIIKNFKVVENEDTNDNFNIYHVVTDETNTLLSHFPLENRDMGVEEPKPTEKATKKNSSKSKNAAKAEIIAETPPKEEKLVNLRFLECNIVGTVYFANLGPYGDWVPEGEEKLGTVISTDNAFKAALLLGLDVPHMVAESLSIIEDTIKEKFYSTEKHYGKFNYAVKSGKTTIKLENKLLLPWRKWHEKQCQNAIEFGPDYENLVPELNDTNDPKGWIQKYAKNLMLDEEEHPVFLRAIPGEKGYEPMERHDIKQGDVVQARIMFEPYQLEGQSVEDGEGKAEWVCGVKLKMTEVMLIRKRGECSTLKLPKKRSGDSSTAPRTPKKMKQRR